jgi:lysyl-tRNA synthetase class 2
VARGHGSDEAERIQRRRRALEVRAAVLRALRAWFEGQGFLEVQTPARVPAPGQEVHLDAFAAEGGRYLITSPEYHMKRLVAAGLPRIVQIARVFRAGERGPHHEPEFTMIEWYRAGEPLEALLSDCEQIVELAARAAGTGRAAEGPVLAAPFERRTVRELVRAHTGIALRGDESAAELRAAAGAAGVVVGEGAAWDDVFFQLFLDRVEPHLGRERPTFVLDWPLPLGALARRHPLDPLLVERFELYARGLELVNAFGELVDPAEQRARFLEEQAIRRARGKTVYPLDEKLLDALGRMPPTCGAAMGFDRLLMLVLGASELREVLAFADDEV